MNSLEKENQDSLSTKKVEKSRSKERDEHKKHKKKEKSKGESSKATKRDKKSRKRSKSRSTSSSSRKNSRSPNRGRKTQSRHNNRSKSHDRKFTKNTRRRSRSKGRRLTSQERKEEEERKKQARLARARGFALLEAKKNGVEEDKLVERRKYEEQKRQHDEQQILREYKKREDLFDVLEEEEEGEVKLDEVQLKVPTKQEELKKTEEEPHINGVSMEELSKAPTNSKSDQPQQVINQQQSDSQAMEDITSKISVGVVEEKPQRAVFVEEEPSEEIEEKKEGFSIFSQETSFNVKVEVKPINKKGFSVPLSKNNNSVFSSSDEGNSKRSNETKRQNLFSMNDSEDPLDAYMKDIDGQATKQEMYGQSVAKVQEEVPEVPENEESEIESSRKVITADEFIQEIERKKMLTVRRTVRAQKYGMTPAQKLNNSFAIPEHQKPKDSLLSEEHQALLDNFDEGMDMDDDDMNDDEDMENEEDPEEADKFHKAFVDAMKKKEAEESGEKKDGGERIYAEDDDNLFPEFHTMKEDEAEDYLAKQKKITERKRILKIIKI